MRQTVKLAFLGDLVLTNSEHLSEKYFEDVKRYFVQNNIKICVNLESPIVSKEMQRGKDKITLQCFPSDALLLKSFAPYLVNLSNNHINDYGNESVMLTKAILTNNDLEHFGVGFDFEKSNYLFKDDIHKLIYLAYTTRSSDFTGSKLFAIDDFMGVREVNLQEIRDVKKNNPEYFLVVNVHWGKEDIVYPEPSKRVLGKKIIDAGADLVIGHHPHIVQPYEKYKDKYIFYSIGNFYFPEIEYELGGEKKIEKVLPHQKQGIIPVFKINNSEIALDKILYVENKRNKQELSFKYEVVQIKSSLRYVINYYMQGLNIFLKRLFRFLLSPKKIKNRILKLLKKVS